MDLLCNIGNSKCNDSKVQYSLRRNFHDTPDVIDTGNSPDGSKNSVEQKKLEDKRTRASSWEKQKILLARAIKCVQRDNVKKKFVDVE